MLNLHYGQENDDQTHRIWLVQQIAHGKTCPTNLIIATFHYHLQIDDKTEHEEEHRECQINQVENL